MSEQSCEIQSAGCMPRGVEWGTLALIIGCYGGWLAVLFLLAPLSVPLAILCLSLFCALHSSLTHEALHGHPFRSRWINEALMFLPLTLMIPYGRFRDTHLAHHQDERLTDPYDDPESNFQDPGAWQKMPAWRRAILEVNNTLLGRIVLGPLLGQICFMADDWRQARAGNHAIRRDWVLHALGLVPVIWIAQASPLPLWALLLAAYIGLALIKIRTFLEHRAHEECHNRTVVIEDRGPLAWLFLNNNLHIVHHKHPGVPWYALPRLYRQNRAAFLAVNGGYRYSSYREVFGKYFLRRKDPVPHPLWPFQR
ncbi:fatty acid desaturase family protein [Roseobacter sp. SK209-2-6]|uniref:fatty acid desaturase n=1 Tax=Roseobacter sp. SK209-2-6 TaxID=388739 RepID=UPI0000F3EC81|nr:fatty acid desaturase [Roseobacter sp. SK209-2-6]EBA16689.1 fatty acid desaturase family protein [Roseobacter sp. SK209-2-6]